MNAYEKYNLFKGFMIERGHWKTFVYLLRERKGFTTTQSTLRWFYRTNARSYINFAFPWIDPTFSDWTNGVDWAELALKWKKYYERFKY